MTKILLVEDDKSLREIYGVRLLAEGYDIVSAGDGEEALAMAVKELPNLIISDVMMPRVSGFDMLDILRANPPTRGIKVIMMTALSSEDQRKRGEQLGADRYLVKSQVGIEDVVKTVHEVLGDGHLTAEQRIADKNAPSQEENAPTVEQPIQDLQPVQIPQSEPAAPVQAPQTPVQPQPAAPAQFSPDQHEVAQYAQAPQSTLPQPTAPFSTDRPAGLGERVIQPPVQSPESEAREAQFAAEIENVLGGFSQQSASVNIPVSEEFSQPPVQQDNSEQSQFGAR